MRKAIIWILIAVTLLFCGGYVFWQFFVMSPYQGNSKRINIPKGSSEAQVGALLADSLGGYGHKVARLWKVQSGDANIAHGSYVIEPGIPTTKFARILARGRQTPVKLTFNNLRTIGDLSRRVSAKLEMDSASFSVAVDSILRESGFEKSSFPAAFLPDTYEFYWTASPEAVVEKLLGVRNDFWTQERCQRAMDLGLTPVEVATLASIVEEESNKADEQPAIARLYMNRIAKGMPLQADPTVKFAVGDFSLRRLLKSHLSVESPYNTYKTTGLPPGPIRIPERSTMERVLSAPQNDYLYMCAKSDFSGYHEFATSYDRHRINAARYQRALDKRGIR